MMLKHNYSFGHKHWNTIQIDKLENVHWSSVPVQIGDPIVAPPGEYV